MKKATFWEDYTINTEGVADTLSQEVMVESENTAVRIGSNANTDTTPGVLVLIKE